MKKQVFSLIAILIASMMSAQTGFNYKALITDNGSALANHSVNIKFTILENGTTSVYQEVHTANTDANGIVFVRIGEGTQISGSFSGIDWSAEQFLKVEIDTGNGFSAFGTTAFSYVPSAKNADKLEGKTVADIKSELDAEKFNSILNRLNNLESQNAALTTQLNNLQNSVQANTSNITSNYNAITDPNSAINSRLSNLDTRATDLETKTADMSIVNLTYEGQSYKTVRFSHVNVQIVNGTGATDTADDGNFTIGTGLGNLIIGYNEEADNPTVYPSNRTGYHNLIVGSVNNYTSYGSVIFGKANTVESRYSTVTGGSNNKVAKPYSSISGGANKSTPNSSSNSDWYYWIGDQYHSN
jgi:hypothetical protein